MKNKNIISESHKINMFISSILLYCGYKMDKNINYKTKINNNIVSNYLKNNLEYNIINYIEKNFDFNGKIIYLRNNADSECMIYYNKSDCYLVFIGTQTSLDDKMSLFKDLWTDICLGLKTINFSKYNVKIHSKYVDNMKCDNLINNIIKIINKLKFKNINICGHSMGCGLGLYTSLVLSNKFKNKYFNLITLDSPKIGDYKLNKYMKKIKNLTHIDYINNKDIVALFPFIYPEYLHISSNTYISDENGKIIICKKPNELNIFTNHSIKDHHTYNIIEKLYISLLNN